MTPKEMAEKRLNLQHEARSLMDKAKAEKRDLTAAEDEKVDRIFTEIDELRTKIDAAEKSESRTPSSTARSGGPSSRPAAAPPPTDPNAAPPTAGGKRWRTTRPTSTAARTTATCAAALARLNADEMRGPPRPGRTPRPSGRQRRRRRLPRRPAADGRDLIKFKDNLVFMRGLATKSTP
jgi:hypothetical protein